MFTSSLVDKYGDMPRTTNGSDICHRSVWQFPNKGSSKRLNLAGVPFGATRCEMFLEHWPWTIKHMLGALGGSQFGGQ